MTRFNIKKRNAFCAAISEALVLHLQSPFFHKKNKYRMNNIEKERKNLIINLTFDEGNT